MHICKLALILLLFFWADKSSTAAALALHYGAACLNVDAVVTEVLQNGTSPVSLSARQLYQAAAAEYAQRKAAEAGRY